MTKFSELGLDKSLLSALIEKGYEVPTPIQAQAIPTVLSGRDLLGIAQTGTGKTAAFALPILHRLNETRQSAPKKGARCLVLAPTRELASQIAESFRDYGKHMGFGVTVIFGGAGYNPQIKALQNGIDILVATPGRLLDLMNERHAEFSKTEILVLDEADQMLDLGFFPSIRKIVATLPKKRQNLFFSATMPGEIGKLAGDMLVDPAKVQVTPSATTVERIDQQVIHVEAAHKRELLAELFEEHKMDRAIVFTRTKRGADKVAKSLEAAGITAAAIHGDKSQAQRERALAAFKAGKVRAMVATDIAARGIDIDAVGHVINFELPFVAEAYVHRIGRTARKGAGGSAISLVADDERPQLRDIQKLTRQTIPALDRRYDKSLALMAQANGTAEVEQKRPQGPRGNQRSGQRHPAAKVTPLAGDRPKGQPHRQRRRGGGGGGGGGGQRAAS
ncbi:MAG: helicase [Caulobacteraceae bacterium]|nr:helicase [Caulobacteraceae bacterium]